MDFKEANGITEFALEFALYLHVSGHVQREPHGESVESMNRRMQYGFLLLGNPLAS